MIVIFGDIVTILGRMSLASWIWGSDELRRRNEILAILSRHPLETTCENPQALSRRDLWALRLQQNLEVLDLKFRYGWSDQHYLDALKIVSPDVASLGVNSRSRYCLSCTQEDG